MAHEHCMLDTQGHKYTVRTCTTSCFSIATMVVRTRLKITFYLYCLSCLLTMRDQILNPYKKTGKIYFVLFWTLCFKSKKWEKKFLTEFNKMCSSNINCSLCIYVCMYVGFKTLFYVVRHLGSTASYLPTGLHLGFFRSWPSLYLPSSVFFRSSSCSIGVFIPV